MVKANDFLDELISYKQNKIDLSNNIFRLLGIEDLEIKHSNFLAYLFNKKCNGNIGTIILYQLLKALKIERYFTDYNDCKYSIDDIFKKCSDIEVKREYNNIDITINFAGFVIILIENKIWADEHDRQLFKYETEIKQKLISDNDLSKNVIKTPVCIFLTSDGRNSNDNDCQNWIPCSYFTIYSILHKFFNSKVFLSLTEKQKILIKDYVDLIRGNIMDKNKEEIKDILNAFYSDNKKKKIIENIIMYAPNYVKRAELIKDECVNNNITILPGSATSYINIVPKEWENIFTSKGLGKNFVYLQVSNNSSFYKTFIQCYFDFQSSDGELNKKYANRFYQEFHNNEVELDMCKDRSLGYNICIISKNSEFNYTESKKQDIITNFFKDFYKNQDIIKLNEFIKKFNV